MPRAQKVLIVAALVTAAAAGPAHAQQNGSIDEARRFTADTYRGVTVWSSFDDSIDAFRLKASSGDKDIDLGAIKPRPTAFDVDLGPLPGGGVGAVYTRCGDEPGTCDVY